MRYVFCTIAIGEKYLSSAIKLAQDLNRVSTKHHVLIVSDNVDNVVDNTTMIKIPENTKTFISNIFNYNLKYLPIKYASELEFDYVIFIDADWSLGEGYSQDKIDSVLDFMNTHNYDFCFERPHLIGQGKHDESRIFWRHKRDFYDLLNTTEFDDGHVVNEQFMIFKNNEKLKTFSSFWESLSNKASESDLWAFAEGVEIGMSSSHSNMSYEYNRWQRLLSNCFIFTTVNDILYKRF
jgi:hypothetical protein